MERALTILELVADRPLSVRELAAALEVDESTALRLARTLHARRLVHRDADRRYRLGGGLFSLAHRALEALDVRDIARPALARLRDDTRFTVHLAHFEDDEVVYIDKFESPRAVRMYSRIGKRAPLHCTAVAKAVVAFLPEAERGALTSRIDYQIFTPNTIPNQSAYLEELRQTRLRGYAIDNGEHEASIVCLAAPIFEAGGLVRHSLSMSVPASEVDLQAMMAWLPLLVATSREISAEMGWEGPRKRDGGHSDDLVP